MQSISKFASLIISLTSLYTQLEEAYCKVSLHLHGWYLKSTIKRDTKKVPKIIE